MQEQRLEMTCSCCHQGGGTVNQMPEEEPAWQPTGLQCRDLFPSSHSKCECNSCEYLQRSCLQMGPMGIRDRWNVLLTPFWYGSMPLKDEHQICAGSAVQHKLKQTRIATHLQNDQAYLSVGAIRMQTRGSNLLRALFCQCNTVGILQCLSFQMFIIRT